MEKGLWDGAYMRILLNGKWHVVLEDGTTGQMDLPGTLDENGIGHRDVGANQFMTWLRHRRRRGLYWQS